MDWTEDLKRKWYESMKAADPYHFAEHEGPDCSADGFPTIHGEYTFEAFSESPMVKHGIAVLASFASEVERLTRQQPDNSYLRQCVKEGPNCDCVNVCKYKPCGAWQPIETAPKTGEHISAADFTPSSVGFGGNPPQPFQCVVHWWQWSDGTHQEEWGWYPSFGPDQALTNLTHWKPLEGLAVASSQGGE